MKAQADAGKALELLIEVKGQLEKLRDENTRQHFEAREMFNGGLSKVHSRLNTLIAGGWTLAIGLLAYLLVYGPPWVSQGQMEKLLEQLK